MENNLQSKRIFYEILRVAEKDKKYVSILTKGSYKMASGYISQLNKEYVTVENEYSMQDIDLSTIIRVIRYKGDK